MYYSKAEIYFFTQHDVKTRSQDTAMLMLNRAANAARQLAEKLHDLALKVTAG